MSLNEDSLFIVLREILGRNVFDIKWRGIGILGNFLGSRRDDLWAHWNCVFLGSSESLDLIGALHGGTRAFAGVGAEDCWVGGDRPLWSW